jgi:hypothetical protein
MRGSGVGAGVGLGSGRGVAEGRTVGMGVKVGAGVRVGLGLGAGAEGAQAARSRTRSIPAIDHCDHLFQCFPIGLEVVPAERSEV